jgi:hypothetical protein
MGLLHFVLPFDPAALPAAEIRAATDLPVP